MTNADLAREFDELGHLCVISGSDPVHCRQFYRLARRLRRLGLPVEQLREEGRLREIWGVGPVIEQYIEEYLDTGTCAKREDLERYMPASVLDLMSVPGIGPIRAAALFQNLGVASLEELEEAILRDQVTEVPRFGPLTVRRIHGYLTHRAA